MPEMFGLGDRIRVTYDSPQSDDELAKEGVVLSCTGSGVVRFWDGSDVDRHYKLAQRTGRLTSSGYYPNEFGAWRHLSELGEAVEVERIE